MPDCPQFNLSVGGYPTVNVNSNVIGPALTLSPAVSGFANVDVNQQGPTLSIRLPESPTVTFYSLEGVNPTQLAATGSALNNTLLLISGYLESIVTGAVSGVTSINTIRGAVQITGAGTVAVTRNGQIFIISGTASGDVTAAQLAATGAQLIGFATGISGYLENRISSLSAGVSQINGISGILTISGIDGISITTAGQNIIVSGNDSKLFNTGQVLSTRITSLEHYFTGFTGGFFAFQISVPTQIDVLHVVYPKVFNSVPVAGPHLSTTGGFYYNMNAYNFSTTGCSLAFGDLVQEPGAIVNFLLKATGI